VRVTTVRGHRSALRVLSACALGAVLWGGPSGPASAATAPSPPQSALATATDTATANPTATDTATASPTATDTATASPTATDTATATATPTETPPAPEYVVRGAIGAKYVSDGGASALGEPLGNEVCTGPRGGCYQWFAEGLIWWSPATGAHTVRNDGFRFRYELENWAWGPLGYPLWDIECSAPGGGCYQRFEGGILWKDPSGGPATWPHGGIGARYAALNWAWGPLGYPTGDEQCYPGSTTCWEPFRGGSIWWSPSTGAHMVRGAIGSAWIADGWDLGLPLQDEQCSGPRGGCYQWFQGAVYWWSSGSGTHYVKGGIKAAYERLNWAWGGLGYPLTNEYAVSTGYRQDFQGGSIVWDRRSGATTVLWR
jgi:uncharacterized protein with LGFP repeats